MAFFFTDQKFLSGTRSGIRLGWTEQPRPMLPSTLYGVTSIAETVIHLAVGICSQNSQKAF
jgi:hypothetical protein